MNKHINWVRLMGARAQRGVSMLFALIALVVLTLGAVALIRSVDTGLLVLGNLGFKQSATSAAAIGTEQAIAWLAANQLPGALDADIAGNAYYASSVEALRPTAALTAASATVAVVDWDGGVCSSAVAGTVCLVSSGAIAAGAGQTVRYVITRLCSAVGAAGGTNSCITPVTNALVESRCRGAADDALCRAGFGSAGPYYRILTRTSGVRRTVSYTETLVHF